MSEEEKKVSDLEAALEKEREDFTSKINSLISMIGKIDSISEAQVLMLSYRHMMVDKLIKYRSAIFKKKANDQNYRKMRIEYYKTQHDLRLDYKEINEFINSDMALRIRQTEIIDNQISFCTLCIETLDRMGFSIKNRISIAEMDYRKNI